MRSFVSYVDGCRCSFHIDTMFQVLRLPDGGPYISLLSFRMYASALFFCSSHWSFYRACSGIAKGIRAFRRLPLLLARNNI